MFMKDIGKLFKDIRTQFLLVTLYYGTHHLDEERKKQGVSQGIKSHSETRFSSSYY